MTSLFDDYAVITESGLFDADYYISANPDVAELNYDPLLHYLELGALEMRNPSRDFNAKDYMQRCREIGEEPENPLLHFIRFAAARAQQQPAAEAEPQILLSLDKALVHNGPGAGVRRVLGDGWVIAHNPITEITVTIGQVGVVVRYGLSRIDVAQTFPQFARADQSGFSFALDGVRPEDTEGSVDVVFTIKTADGKTHRHSAATYLVEAPAESEVVQQAAAEPAFMDLPPLKLEIDSSAIDKTGVLHLIGWAVCFAPITAVQVFIDDERLGAAHYGQPRDDVGLAFPDYPGSSLSGFALTSDISGVWNRAQNAKGPSRRIDGHLTRSNGAA